MSNKSIPGIYNSILAQDTGQIDDTNRYNENNDKVINDGIEN